MPSSNGVSLGLKTENVRLRASQLQRRRRNPMTKSLHNLQGPSYLQKSKMIGCCFVFLGPCHLRKEKHSTNSCTSFTRIIDITPWKSRSFTQESACPKKVTPRNLVHYVTFKSHGMHQEQAETSATDAVNKIKVDTPHLLCPLSSA